MRVGIYSHYALYFDKLLPGKFTIYDSIHDLAEADVDFAFVDINANTIEDYGAAKSVKHPKVILADSVKLYRTAIRLNAIAFIARPYEDAAVKKRIEDLFILFENFSRIVFADGRILRMVDISYLEVQDRITIIHHFGSEIDSDHPLQYWEQILKEDFVLTHRGILVNVQKISKINKDTLTLYDGTVLPVSRRNKRLVTEAVIAHSQYQSREAK